MTRTSTVLVRALGAALVLAPALGWTTYKAVTAKRAFEGSITVWADRQLPNGKWHLVDEFKGSGFTFQASLAELARGKRVETDWALTGKSAKGRPFSVKLVRPGLVERNVQTGSVTLRLPVRWEIEGRHVENEVLLSTDASFTGPEGVIRGRRLNVQNGASAIGLVGQTAAGQAGAELVEIERKPGAELVELEREPGGAEQRKPRATEQSAQAIFKDLGATTLHILVDGKVRAVAEQ